MLERTRDLRQKHRAELASHAAEAQRREEQFKAESEKRLKALEEQYRAEAAAFQKGCPKPPSQREFGDSLKARLRAIAAQLSQATNRAMGARETQLIQLKNLEEESTVFVREMAQLAKELVLRDKDRADRLSQADRPYLEMIDRLRRQKEEQGISHAADIEGVKAKNAEILRRLKTEFDQEKAKFSASDAQCREMLAQLQKVQEREIDELNSKQAAEAVERAEKQKRLQLEMKKAKKQWNTELTRIKSQLGDAKHNSESLEAALQKEQATEQEKIRTEFEREINTVCAQISKRSGEFAQSENRSRAELEDLKESKMKTIQMHSLAIEDFEANEKQTMSSSHDFQSDQMAHAKISSDQELSDFQANAARTIDVWKSQAEQRKSTRRQELSSISACTLHELETGGFSKEEYNSVRADRQNYFDSLGRELQDIQPPKLTDNALYQEVNLEFERLQREKREQAAAITAERNNLDDKWKGQVEAECERHKHTRPPSASGRNRDQVKQALQRQIDDVRTALHLETRRLQEVLAAEQSRHAESMKRYISICDDIRPVGDFSRAQDSLTKLKDEAQTEIDAAILRVKQETDSLQLANQVLAQEFVKKIETSERQLQDLIANFQISRESLNQQRLRLGSDRDRNASGSSNELDRQIRDLADVHSKKRLDLIKRCDALRNEAIETEERNKIGLNEENNRQQASLIEYSRKVQEEIETRKSDWEGLLSYLLERIEVLTVSRDTMRAKFENREGRACDLDAIQDLQEYLKTIQFHLTTKLKDLSQYRSLMVEQEKTFNLLFGKNPSVGVYRFSSDADAAHVRRSSTQA
jgi:hypothetical protein